mgnify:CR=1 FL=1
MPQDTNRAPLEYSLFHVVNESLQVGIEYDYAEDQFHPAAAYRLLEATDSTPAVILGTSSAWPSGEVDGSAFMLNVADMISEDISLAVGTAYVHESEEWLYTANLAMRLKEGLSASFMYDGANVHPVMTLDREGTSIQFILFNGEDPGIAVSFFQ